MAITQEMKEAIFYDYNYFDMMKKLSREDRIEVIKFERKHYSPRQRVVKHKRRLYLQEKRLS